MLPVDQLQAAGYYQFLPQSPGVTQSVAQKHVNVKNPDGSAHATTDRQNMAHCYLFPTPQESNPELFAANRRTVDPILVSTTDAAIPLFRFTDVIELPAARNG
jgi:hypothetical protein